MATAQTSPTPLTFTIPFAKVDKEKRLVRGVATAEVLDAHGQIVDYETAKAAIPEWIGNIREMHEPKAVGKRTAVEFDDENKQIILESYISKGAEDTWQKVLDGTLSMYSIGGSGVVQKDKSAPKGRILMKEFDEISLVDNGACPAAKFDIVKSINGKPMGVQPEDVAEPAATETVEAKHAAVVVELQKFQKQLTAPMAAAAAAKVIAKLEGGRVLKAYPESYDIQLALGAIAQLEQLISDEYWEARDEALAGGTADDPKVAQAQLALLRSAVTLVIQFLSSEFEEQFGDIDDAAAANAAADPDAVAMAKTKRVAKRVAVIGPALLTVDFVTEVMKAGARHSKADVEMIQKMHDSAVGLGASCKPEKRAEVDPAPAVDPAAEPVEKTDPAPAVTTEPAAQPDVQSIVKAAVDEALKAHQATSDKTIAELTERIDKLAKTPKPGGPVTRPVAVEKQLAGTDPAAQPPAVEETDEVLKAFDVIAEQAKTPDERTTIAAKKLAYMRAHNLGVLPRARAINS